MDIENNCEAISSDTQSKKLIDEKSLKIIDKIFLACFIAGVVGSVLFLGIVIVGAIAYKHVYLFDGYKFTKALTIISIIFMLIGLFSVVAKAVMSLIFKIGVFPKTIVKRVLLILLAAICFSFSVWGFVDCAKTGSKGSDSSSSNSSSGSSTVSKYLGLSLKVTNIKTSGSYTYVYCSIQNISALYGNATMYRYVKVKAVFYNSANIIVDTDWTYAVDSAWLSSGETKTFHYMVRDTTVKSAKLSIIS